MAFVIQNYPQTSTGTNYNWTMGNGPFGTVSVSGGRVDTEWDIHQPRAIRGLAIASRLSSTMPMDRVTSRDFTRMEPYQKAPASI